MNAIDWAFWFRVSEYVAVAIPAFAVGRMYETWQNQRRQMRRIANADKAARLLCERMLQMLQGHYSQACTQMHEQLASVRARLNDAVRTDPRMQELAAELERRKVKH